MPLEEQRVVAHGTLETLLEKQVEDDGKASIEYVYGDREGIPVLVRATLVEGEHRYAALVDWSEFVRSPTER